jgi:hypothetical protein
LTNSKNIAARKTSPKIYRCAAQQNTVNLTYFGWKIPKDFAFFGSKGERNAR